MTEIPPLTDQFRNAFPYRINSMYRPQWLRCLLLLVLPLTLVPGCGGDSEPAASSESSASAGAEGSAAPSAAAKTETAEDAGSSKTQATTVSSDSGRKMLGDIPYDVFFDDPLGIITNSQPVAPATPAAGTGQAATPPAATTTEPEPETVAASGGADWKSLISEEILDSEVKTIRNYLNQKLQSVGTFNQALFEIPPRSSTLAVLAAIATEHKGEIRWKDNAGIIRDLAAQMHADALQRGAKSQKAVLAPFEGIVDTFNGSPPADAGDGSAAVEFYEVADMDQLMKRMEMAFNWMQTEASNADSFKAEADTIKHEAAILGTLMKVVSTEGYGYGDDEDFLAYSNPIVEAAGKITQAVQTEDFDTYDATLSAIGQSCTGCHSDYKNN